MLPAFQDGSQDETLDNSDLNLSESRDTGQHSGGQSGGDPLDGLDGKWSNSVSLSLPPDQINPRWSHWLCNPACLSCLSQNAAQTQLWFPYWQ